jgi:hypothetical protein
MPEEHQRKVEIQLDLWNERKAKSDIKRRREMPGRCLDWQEVEGPRSRNRNLMCLSE